MTPWEFIKEDGWLVTLVFLAFGLLILVFFYVEMMKDKKCQEEEEETESGEGRSRCHRGFPR